MEKKQISRSAIKRKLVNRPPISTPVADTQTTHQSHHIAEEKNRDSSNPKNQIFASVHRPRHSSISALKQETLNHQQQIKNPYNQRQLHQIMIPLLPPPSQSSHFHFHYKQPHLEIPSLAVDFGAREQEIRVLPMANPRPHNNGNSEVKGKNIEGNKRLTQTRVQTINTASVAFANSTNLRPPIKQAHGNSLNDEDCAIPTFSNIAQLTSVVHKQQQPSQYLTLQHPQQHPLQYPQQYPHKHLQQQPQQHLQQHPQQHPQQQHSQQKQQHQLQSHSIHIPITHNFDQMSNTTDNLLNDIYEKHLLNQTTFENVNIMQSYGMITNACENSVDVVTTDDVNFINKIKQIKMPPSNDQSIVEENCVSDILLSTNKNNCLYEEIVPPTSEFVKPFYGHIRAISKLPQQQQYRIIDRSKKIMSDDGALKSQKNVKNMSDKVKSVQQGHSSQHHLATQSPFTSDYSYIQLPRNYYPQQTSIKTEQKYHQLQQPLPIIPSQCRANPIGGNSSAIDLIEENFKVLSNDIKKKNHRNSKIDIMLETAQAIAAATYFARAAQRMAMNNTTNKNRSSDSTGTDRGGYCGALQRAPPPMPVALSRRLANKENSGLGKVKVMLRVSDSLPTDNNTPSYLSIDKKKRQVTLSEPSVISVVSGSQERGPMVAAPKMFAFDALFTNEDSQMDICASALSEVIPAVLEGSDGCLLALGHPGTGQTKTMLGSIASTQDLGGIPCAISWLYRGINERRQKSGSRFSVRVSALGVNATKPGSSSKDLLAAHATESDDSPGVYLRDDFLGGPTELRAPTAERAALFLDAALASRTQGNLEPALIFTLHVYQYSLAGKGGVAGGRSRLHLIDMGGCANRNGGLPLSGIGNVLLAILSGQRHPPNRDHPFTPLLKDCLAPLTCHVSIIAHVTHSQTHTDALTTIQLASRIHRLRRRKHRFPLTSDKNVGLHNSNSGHQSGGSSEGPDPSSSDLSADTVIYMGPCGDDATDGEHPPVYLPSLSSGDNRCAMGRVLKGSAAEKPNKLSSKKNTTKNQSSVAVQRTDSLKKNQIMLGTATGQQQINNDNHTNINNSSSPKVSISNAVHSAPKIVAGAFKHTAMSVSRGSNAPTPKGSPLRRPNITVTPDSSLRGQLSEEKWIDGPRVSRSKVAEARHLMREINHIKQCETWIDGPKLTSPKFPLNASSLPGTSHQAGTYGFMDSHKKSMIRKWVENQTSQIFTSNQDPPTAQQQVAFFSQLIPEELAAVVVGDDTSKVANEKNVIPVTENFTAVQNPTNIIDPLHDQCDVIFAKPQSSKCDRQQNQSDSHEEEDQDSGPSEVPPALPLLEPLGSREISHESIQLMCSRVVSRESLGLGHVQTIDCGLQVTEEDIARTMSKHPLSALSQGEISVVSSFHVDDAFSDCIIGDRTRYQFDQLARLRELFTSQLAMAEVTPAFRIGDAGSVYSEPGYRFNTGPSSVCSEPAYRPPSPICRGCRQSITLSRTPSQTSLPSLAGIVAIASMEQYASLRHPDGASDPNLQKIEECSGYTKSEIDCKEASLLMKSTISSECINRKSLNETPLLTQTQLPMLPLTTLEAYDSGHDSTPRTSKHSGISRRAESGYHSVATARDSDESSFGSAASQAQRIGKHDRKKHRPEKSLCNWLRNPFTCTYPDTEGEISDF